MKNQWITITWCFLISFSCQLDKTYLTLDEFKILMDTLAYAWTNQHTELALTCFTQDAIYMQPPDEQLFKGKEQLRPFFGALKKGTEMRFHYLWFDPKSQSGAGEFTFGNSQSKSAVTGVTVVKLEKGKIKNWREYFIKGPMDFKEFSSPDKKNWKWHIGNYP